jgi:hypothetical protein
MAPLSLLLLSLVTALRHPLVQAVQVSFIDFSALVCINLFSAIHTCRRPTFLALAAAAAACQQQQHTSSRPAVHCKSCKLLASLAPLLGTPVVSYC